MNLLIKVAQSMHALHTRTRAHTCTIPERHCLLCLSLFVYVLCVHAWICVNNPKWLNRMLLGVNTNFSHFKSAHVPIFFFLLFLVHFFFLLAVISYSKTIAVSIVINSIAAVKASPNCNWREVSIIACGKKEQHNNVIVMWCAHGCFFEICLCIRFNKMLWLA